MSSQGIRVPSTQLRLFQEPQTRPALTFHTDGFPNEKEGCCYWSWLALNKRNKVIAKQSGKCGDSYGITVNVAKTHAVIQALSWIAENMPDKPVTVLCDLKHVVKTVNGEWKAHNSKLLCQTAQQYLSRTKATLEWIAHVKNRAA